MKTAKPCAPTKAGRFFMLPPGSEKQGLPQPEHLGDIPLLQSFVNFRGRMLFSLTAHSVTSKGKTSISHTKGLGLVDYILEVRSPPCEVLWTGVKVQTVGVRDSASMGLSVEATDSECAMTLHCEVDTIPPASAQTHCWGQEPCTAV